MKWAIQVGLLAIFMVALPSCCRAQSRTSRFDSAPAQGSSAGRESFLDFVLARINPTNSDYGDCLSEGRRVLVHETLQNGYFWSNIVALASLVCLLLIIVHQHRVQARREWGTAELLAQLEHALARSKAQFNVASRNNHEIASELAAARELIGRGIPRSPEPTELAERTVTSPAKTRATVANFTPPTISKVKLVTPAVPQLAATGNATQPADQMRLFTPDVDLIMKLNSLEQQLAHSQRDNSALRRRIADGDRRPESGRQVKDA